MFQLPPTTRMGAVHLTVTNLSNSADFYQTVLGLKVQRRKRDFAALGAGGEELVLLYENPAASPLRQGHTGLYHFAILVPNRVELAQVLYRIANTNTTWQGAADHHVSEALYIADPDGNGIEIYRDRPRDAWQYINGQLQMGTDRLDLKNVLAELEQVEGVWQGLPPTTTMGHIHLHVRDTAEAEAFYGGMLGFDLMVRYGDSASFMAAGGYHHHLGLNTWAGVGAPPPPADSVGLRWYEMLVPTTADLNAIQAHLQAQGIAYTTAEHGITFHDPSMNGIWLKVG